VAGEMRRVDCVVEAEAGFVERLAHPGDAERCARGSRSRRPRARRPTAPASP
jgi:hypothetical protein